MYTPALHNEQDILAGLAAGEKEAFEALYRHRWLPVFHFIKRFVADQQAAEDITTDTFLKVWHKRRDFTLLDKLDAYIFTAARHASLNYLRDKKRHLVKQRELATGESYAEQPDLGQQEVTVRVLHHIYAQIDQLPEKMRLVLRLHLEGVKNEAIATELGIAEKTVRNLKVEAIKLLRVRLSPHEFALLQLFLFGLTAFAEHGIK